MANSDSTKTAVDQSRESYADDAKARRVLLVDDDSNVPFVGDGADIDVQGDDTSSTTEGTSKGVLVYGRDSKNKARHLRLFAGLLQVEEQNGQTLSKILVELRKLNFHLSLVTDNELKDEDVENDDD